ncbi:MAG: prepilin-type N-terminal cleavage/methylation domain-containing protein [Akkermansiaceae bacterium]|nr:prepilin-type N-terminal cleavage/methylation domain-containing protein [Akkermansiaceae bacterium]
MKTPTPAHISKCPSRGRRAGFTLIELLVSMAITSVLMLALLSLVGTFTENYTNTQRSLNSISQARSFLQFFDSELSTRLPNTPLIHEEDEDGSPSSSDKFAFIRALTDDEQATFGNLTTPDLGDLGTSLYYVEYSDDPLFAPCYNLYRRDLGPEETQQLIEDSLTTPDPAFPASTPSEGEPIIPYVLRFRASPKYRDPADGELKDWEATDTEPPSVIELEITFVDESAAQRYKTQTEWDRLATSPRDNELRFIRTFTRSIAIAK